MVTAVYKLQKVGTDAEVFLRSIKTNRPHPAIGMLGGTKLMPLPIESLGAGFFIQEDNVMPEFNIPACDNAQEFSDNIGKVHSWLTDKMSARGYRLDIVPSMFFTMGQLKHPQAQEVGCEPDYCVWTRMPNESPKMNPVMEKLRTASAHIHVSFLVNDELPADIMAREAVVKAMDITIGLPSLVLDEDKTRRQLYGKAGAFRPKPYGIEHRVASNFWIRTPELRRWAFRGVQDAINLCNQDKGKYLRDICRQYGAHLRSYINNGDGPRAEKLLLKLELGGRLNAS